MQSLTFAEAVATHRHEVRPVPASAAFDIRTAAIRPGVVSTIMAVPVDATTGHGPPPASLATLVADVGSGAALRHAGHLHSNATLTMHMDVVDRFPRSGHLHCMTEVVSSAGARRHLVHGTVTDEADRVVATSRSWWLAGNRHAPPADSDQLAPDPVAAGPGASLVSRFGIEELQAAKGVRVRANRIRPYLNRRQALHGGVAAILCEIAADRAIAQAGLHLPSTLWCTTLYYARAGVRTDSVDIEASIVWARKNFATVEARVLTAGGDDAIVTTFFRGEQIRTIPIREP